MKFYLAAFLIGLGILSACMKRDHIEVAPAFGQVMTEEMKKEWEDNYVDPLLDCDTYMIHLDNDSIYIYHGAETVGRLHWDQCGILPDLLLKRTE